jgi:hypothetical protein
MLAARPSAARGPAAASAARRSPAVSSRARVQGAVTSRRAPGAVAAAAAPLRHARAPLAPAATATAADPSAALRALADGSNAQHPLRAVVYGGGLAGLAAARVLADHFDEVVLLERDAVPLTPPGAEGAAAAGLSANAAALTSDPVAAAAAARRGVPQFRQPHQLLARGLEEIERLFPGATEDLYGHGAAEVAVPGGYLVYDDRMGLLKHKHAAVRLVGSTRALLESVVRARLVAPATPEEEEGAKAALPPARSRVRVVPGAVVTGWVLEQPQQQQQDASPPRVAGVRVRAAGGGEDETLELRADLVVDASGRGSRAPEWLEAAGYAAPEVTTVSAGTVYLTATYKIPASALPAPLNPDAGPGVADADAIARFRASSAAPAPSSSSSSSTSSAERTPGYGIMCYTSYPCTRSSILMPVEGGLHQLICCAKHNDLPEGAKGEGGAPTDATVLAFADSLADKGATARALRAGERVGEISTYRRTENFRRRYEKLAEEEEGAVAAERAAAEGAGAAAPVASTRRWRALPRGWVAIGDANVAFNPAYGQGISVGVLEALELGKLVGSALKGVAAPEAAASARRDAVASVGAPFFRRALPSVVEVPWAIAAGTDAPFAPGFVQTPAEKMIAAYFEGVVELAADDPGAYDALVASMHLTAPAGSLLHPSIALRVAWRGLRRKVMGVVSRGEASGGGVGASTAAGGASAR